MSQIIQENYIPTIKKYYPSGLEEIRGIADGAGISLEDIVLPNARYDLARIDEADGTGSPTTTSASVIQTPQKDIANECTSAFFLQGATQSGNVLNCQNWDMSARLWLDDCIIYLEVHPDPSENKPPMFLVTEAGQLGRSGMNSYRLGVTANSLMSTDDFVPTKGQAVLPISLLRRMVLESSHLAEATTAIQNFPRYVSNNLTIATAENFGFCFEIIPDRVYKVYSNISNNYLAQTNHFIHSGFLSRSDICDRYPGGSSWFRRQRFEQRIHYASLKAEVNHDTLFKLFSDHLSYPEALCCHPDASPDMVISNFLGYPFRGASATVACVVYDLTNRSIRVCKGPPYLGIFETFVLDGPQSTKLGNENGNGKGRLELP